MSISLLILSNKQGQNVPPRNKIIDLLRRCTALLQNLTQSLNFLASIILTLAHLLGNLNIVLGVLILQTLSGLLNLTHKVREVVRRDIFRDDIVKLLDLACVGVQSTADSAVSSGFLVQEVDEGLFRSSALVRNRFGRALREELDSWVTGDTLFLGEGAGVLGFGINLRDDYTGFEGEIISEGLPDWS